MITRERNSLLLLGRCYFSLADTSAVATCFLVKAFFLLLLFTIDLGVTDMIASNTEVLAAIMIGVGETLFANGFCLLIVTFEVADSC